MFEIRKEQQNVFSQVSIQKFEDEMLTRITEFFPEDYVKLKETETRKKIKLGILKAKDYGFTTKKNVCYFIYLMFILGYDFDTNPEILRAFQVLNDKREKDPTSRMNNLKNKILEITDDKSRKKIDVLFYNGQNKTIS